MTRLISFILISFFAFSGSALAQSEVPLPPPNGPGGGNPGTPQPPHRPPERSPDRPPYEDPSNPYDPPSYPGGETRTYSLGSADTTRFASRNYSFVPRSGLSRIHLLHIRGTHRKVRIKSVWVYYNDGSGAQQVSGLTGTLTAGQSRTAYLNGARSVRQIVVTAANSGVWRKGGGFRVDATAYSDY